MKRLLCLLLCIFLLIPFAGCSQEEKTVMFYYLRQRDDYVYGTFDGVVTGEHRDSSGHTSNTRYLLTLYLQGPVTEGLVTPFPQNCTLEEVHREGSEISVTLSNSILSLEGMDRTLACVCLAKTCFSLTRAQTLEIYTRTETGKAELLDKVTVSDLLFEEPSSTSEK